MSSLIVFVALVALGYYLFKTDEKTGKSRWGSFFGGKGNKPK